MNLLKEGIDSKGVIPTEHLKKLTIEGHSENYKVYKIRLDMLYYNDQNDRIATWISKYKVENNITEFDKSDMVKYNNIIHNFVTESNAKAIERTQKNIRMIEQEEPGVVLLDGRIIDGNRRFTCLRNIEKEDIETGYFKAVILDREIKNDKKQIKMLELSLQHGKDEKVGYNPVDKLVGLYYDVIKEDTKLLTIKEYAKSVGQDKKDIQIEVEKAELMQEFLDFFNMSEQFHRIQELGIFDALNELNKSLKKITDKELQSEFKNTVFVHLFYYDKAKRGFIRDINKILRDKKYINEFINEQNETVMNVLEQVCEVQEMTTSQISNLKAHEGNKNSLQRASEKILTKVNSETTKNLPIIQTDKVIGYLEGINVNIFKKLNKEQKGDLLENLLAIETYISNLKDELDV